MLLPRLLLVSAALAGCTSSSSDPSTGDALPAATGSYAGSYRVPVSASLEAAALFTVDHVDWTVAGGIATLHYDLPVGLVGGALSVTLSGPFAAGDTTATLTGTGTGTCTAAGTLVTCREEFANLGTLPISQAVVEARAATEYPGPAADRVTVAGVFSSDPIGFVDFDLTTPPLEDDGGSGGGHGSGN